MVDASPISVSGAPPPEGDCDRCPTPFKGLDLMKAGYHHRLRGTKRLRGDRLGRLRVCRRCDRLWTENHDAREHYTWYADMGLGALDLIAEDCTPERLVAWAARESTERGEYWVRIVLEAWLKRRRSWAGKIFDSVLATLAAPVEFENEQAAARQASLLDLAGTAAELAPGGRGWPPKPDADAVIEACRSHPPPPCEGLAYAGKNTTLMRNRALLVSTPPPTPVAGAPLVAESLAPLIDAAIGRPLADERRGYSRGQRLRRGYLALRKLRDDCGRWAIDSAKLSMPIEGWRELDAALDPVPHLARQVDTILAVPARDAEQRRDAIIELETFLPPLAEAGARVTSPTLTALRSLQRKLNASEAHPDRVALNAIHGVVATLARDARMDCTSITGTCAS